MIAGLLRATGNNSIDKTPYLGDIPVLGALFRSTHFQKQESELVVIVTPYLVRPVSTQMATPIDGFRIPDDIQRDWMGQTYSGKSGFVQPTAVPARPAVTVAPGVAGAATTAAPAPAPGFKL
jgi:pilus assembly protein CpaC